MDGPPSVLLESVTGKILNLKNLELRASDSGPTKPLWRTVRFSHQDAAYPEIFGSAEAVP